ncbi:hypothetical protein D3C76_1274160 [compost metagenome]
MALTRSASPSSAAVTVKVEPVAVPSPPPSAIPMSSKIPVPGFVSTCHTKAMGPGIAPPTVTLSASLTVSANTVNTWPTAGVPSLILSKPTGSAFKPATRTRD